MLAAVSHERDEFFRAWRSWFLRFLRQTYGLQAIIFILKRQWQFVGWLVIYILAYPVYSFVLPLYSFWRFDE